MAVTFKLRRGTAAAIAAANPVLQAGEPCLETDTNKVKYGDGTTAWTSLPYANAGGGGSGGVSDGNKGDITVSNSGTTFTINANAVTMADLSDTARAAINLFLWSNFR